jgi:Peptidase A4 family
MHPRRSTRSRRYSSGSGGATRRLLLIAAVTSVPVLIVGYALTTGHGGRAVDTADVTGTSLRSAYGHTSVDGDWGRGGYPMMPGSGGYSRAPSNRALSNAATGTVTAAASENWAGYAAAGAPGSFTRVSAAWTEPTVSCTAAQTFASFWVGLDGDGTSTVEQTGTEADCANGAASYQGWFEMFPAAPVFFSKSVKPGDAMSASVVANGGGAFTLTLTDSTQGWTKTTHQTADTAQLGSAEIIAEAPSSGAGTVLPLSDFGAVNFTDARMDDQAVGSLNTAEVTMESAEGAAEATPSALTGADAFTVTVDNGAAVTAGPGTGQRHRHRHHGFGG